MEKNRSNSVFKEDTLGWSHIGKDQKVDKTYYIELDNLMAKKERSPIRDADIYKGTKTKWKETKGKLVKSNRINTGRFFLAPKLACGKIQN